MPDRARFWRRPAGRQTRWPLKVESAARRTAGELDYWVRERQEWWGRVRGADGHHVWIKASDLRPAEAAG